MSASTERRTTNRRSQAIPVGHERRVVKRRSQTRRESERLPLELWMEEMAGQDIYFRRTGNVSIGGAFFDRAIPHPVGTLVTLKFSLPGEQEMVVARGKVVTVRAKDAAFGMGVRFMKIEGNGQARIAAYLANA